MRYTVRWLGCAAALALVPAGAVAAPEVRAYSFPPGLLGGAGSAPGGAYSRLDAVVGIPDGTGPHPVVIVAPGSYPQCVVPGRDVVVTGQVSALRWPAACGTRSSRSENGLTGGPFYVRWPASFATLARALAARGMVAVVIDTYAKDAMWYGEPIADEAVRRVVDAHLGVMRAVNAGRSPIPWASRLAGRVDVERMAVVTHSSTAGYLFARLNRNDTPALVAGVALQPVLNSEPSNRTFPRPVPLMVVAGQCDEQANPGDVARTVGRVATANPDSPLVFARMAATTHIGMVGGGGDHRVGLVSPVKGAACARGRLAPARAIQRVTARLVADYLAERFANAPTVTVPTTRGLRVTAARRAGNLSASVTTVRSLPPWVAPRSVRFTSTRVRILPALPRGERLMTSGDGASDTAHR